MNMKCGPEQTSRSPLLLHETSEEEHRSIRPEPRQPVMDTPRELPPGPAQDVDSWIENYWRNEARWLEAQVQELKHQLRRRTLVLGSSLALMTGATVGTVVVLLLSSP